MQYQQLGNTGVFVSRLCMGAMTFGGAGSALFEVIGGLGQTETNALVGQSIDGGINFFDTANVYSRGESETLLGKALGNKRHDVVIASKVYGRMGSGANEVGLSRLHIMQSIDASLARLGTDYIDLYQVHGFDAVTPLDETLRALDDLVRVGKVRYIGCSNFTAWQTMKALGISAQEHSARFVTIQAYYSLAGRDIEREIVPLMNDQKLGLLPWSPLAGGFLTGKFTRAGAADDQSRRSKFNFPPVNMDKGYAIVDALQEIAARRNASVAQVALAWLLHQPVVSSVIIGARKASQLADNLGAVDVKLDAEDLKKLDDVSRLATEYPGWMQSLPSERRPGERRDWSRAAAPAKS
jgi:aryl-alcohol dehydrogenase-like predicted oxidoreductase